MTTKVAGKEYGEYGPSPLLELVDTITIPATTEKFVAREKFTVNTSNKAEVKVSYLGSDFSACFLDKIEEPVGESVLRRQRLCRAEVDGPIISALGGKDRAVITLTEFYGFLKKADKGEWFVCYCYDKDGLLRAVYALWFGGGWFVRAGPVVNPFRWSEGRHVLSRNS